MSIVLECLPMAALLACLLYLCIRIKARGRLFILSVVYLALQIAYKAGVLITWQITPFSLTGLFGIIGSALTIANYVLLLVIFGHVLKNKAQYSNHLQKEEKSADPKKAAMI